MLVSTRGRLTAVLSLLVLCCTLALAASLVVTSPSASAAGHSHATRWDCLAHYESTHRWKVNTGNGHYGGLQFSSSTWQYFGGVRYSENRWPHKATRREQIHVAKRVAFRGWRDRAPQGGASAWPNTWGHCF